MPRVTEKLLESGDRFPHLVFNGGVSNVDIDGQNTL